MLRFDPSPESGQTAVTFAVRSDELAGQTLAVVGDFNAWEPTAHPMVEEDGSWQTTVVLPAGRYAFRYLAGDGSWLDEQDAQEFDDNGMGGRNSVLHVPGAPEQVPGRDEPSEPPTMPGGPSAPQPTPPAKETDALQDAAAF